MLATVEKPLDGKIHLFKTETAPLVNVDKQGNSRQGINLRLSQNFLREHKN